MRRIIGLRRIEIGNILTLRARGGGAATAAALVPSGSAWLRSSTLELLEYELDEPELEEREDRLPAKTVVFPLTFRARGCILLNVI